MNHQKVYDNIIEKAKSKQRVKLKKDNINYVYYENHHILPICLDGANDKDNLVLLTAREHFVCHKLLTYIHKGNRKIACAYHRMTYGKYKNNKSSRDYKYARELMSNTPISEETREKIRQANKGIIFTKEHIEKIRQANKGKKLSIENKKKLHDINTGVKNKFYGKKHTLDSLEKMSNAASLRIGNKNGMYGKHHSQTSKEKISGIHKDKKISNKQKQAISDKLKNRKFSIETKEKMRLAKLGKSRISKICKYCGKEMAVGNFERYHNNNCKLK